jgi:hypothetical protein
MDLINLQLGGCSLRGLLAAGRSPLSFFCCAARLPRKAQQNQLGRAHNYMAEAREE